MSSAPTSPPACAALWIGGALSDIASACLASFVETGHPVVLYAYRRPIGSKAMSHVSHRYALFEHAQPSEVFYPLPLSAADECCRADADIGRFVTGRTHCIHLWNHRISRQNVEAGSFMSRILDGTWRNALPAT